MLCRYPLSGVSVTIKFDDMARQLNARRQSGTEAGEKNDELCRYTPSVLLSDMARHLNVRKQSATEADTLNAKF